MRTRTSIDILDSQRQAMQVIENEQGSPMTAQVKIGLNLFFARHKELLEKNGFQFGKNGDLKVKP